MPARRRPPRRAAPVAAPVPGSASGVAVEEHAAASGPAPTTAAPVATRRRRSRRDIGRDGDDDAMDASLRAGRGRNLTDVSVRCAQLCAAYDVVSRPIFAAISPLSYR